MLSVHLIHALRPWEGLSSLHSAVTRPSSGRRAFRLGGGGWGDWSAAHPLRGICRKHDHRGSVNAFLSSGQTIRQLRAFRVILRRTSEEKQPAESTHDPASSFAAAPGETRSSLLHGKMQKHQALITNRAAFQRVNTHIYTQSLFLLFWTSPTCTDADL